MQLRVAAPYVAQFGHLAKAGNTLVLLATLSDVSSMIPMAMNIIRQEPVLDSAPVSPPVRAYVLGKPAGNGRCALVDDTLLHGLF